MQREFELSAHIARANLHRAELARIHGDHKAARRAFIENNQDKTWDALGRMASARGGTIQRWANTNGVQKARNHYTPDRAYAHLTDDQVLAMVAGVWTGARGTDHACILLEMPKMAARSRGLVTKAR